MHLVHAERSPQLQEPGTPQGLREDVCQLVCRADVIHLHLAFFYTLTNEVKLGNCGGINPYTLTAKLGLAWIDRFSPPER